VRKAAVSVQKSDGSSENVQVVHEVHQVFAVILSNIYHTLHG
jgi:hypothetical protein